MYISAAAHDYDHPYLKKNFLSISISIIFFFLRGYNNVFLINTGNPLALRYNGKFLIVIS